MGLSQIQAIERFSLFSWLWRRKFLVLFLMFTLPLVIGSIVTSIQEKNYSRPFVELGISTINGDYMIGKNVELLKIDKDLAIGMKYPNVGIYQHTKYYFKIFLLVWKFLGYLFLISVPFYIFYFIFNLINTSAKLKNIILSGIFGISFIFIINLLITIINLSNGTLILTLSGNQFSQILQVIFQTIPFHGIISLISYLINLFI